jgi:hypothetical protein
MTTSGSGSDTSSAIANIPRRASRAPPGAEEDGEDDRVERDREELGHGAQARCSRNSFRIASNLSNIAASIRAQSNMVERDHLREIVGSQE